MISHTRRTTAGFCPRSSPRLFNSEIHSCARETADKDKPLEGRGGRLLVFVFFRYSQPLLLRILLSGATAKD